MREKKDTFFLRQHVKLTPKPKPSNRDDVIRLKFLEGPYRIFKKVPRGYRIAFFSIIWAGIIPYVIYNGIVKIIKYEHKAKLRATLDNDEEKVYQMLEKIKIC